MWMDQVVVQIKGSGKFIQVKNSPIVINSKCLSFSIPGSPPLLPCHQIPAFSAVFIDIWYFCLDHSQPWGRGGILGNEGHARKLVSPTHPYPSLQTTLVKQAELSQQWSCMSQGPGWAPTVINRFLVGLGRVRETLAAEWERTHKEVKLMPEPRILT